MRSRDLACLAECGAVQWERRGKFMEYELSNKRVRKLLDEAEELLLEVGSLIEACRRYRGRRAGPGRRSGKESPQWRR